MGLSGRTRDPSNVHHSRRDRSLRVEEGSAFESHRESPEGALSK